MRAARAARIFCLIQPIRSLIYGVVVAAAVVFALANKFRPALTFTSAKPIIKFVSSGAVAFVAACYVHTGSVATG